MIEFFELDYVIKSGLIDTEQIVHLHKNLGWQCPKIAKYYNVSGGCIQKRMRKNGYQVDRPFDFFTKDELYWLYHEKNKSSKEIADLHGACEREILLKLREFDIEIKDPSDYDREDVKTGPDQHSEEAKRKMRKSYIEELKEKHGEVVAPNYNPDACDIIEEYGEEHGYNFQHAENDGEHHIEELGYFVDGYDKKQNVVIEVDEPYHYENGELRQKDKRRQKQIEEHLGCEFIRIKI